MKFESVSQQDFRIHHVAYLGHECLAGNFGHHSLHLQALLYKLFLFHSKSHVLMVPYRLGRRLAKQVIFMTDKLWLIIWHIYESSVISCYLAWAIIFSELFMASSNIEIFLVFIIAKIQLDDHLSHKLWTYSENFRNWKSWRGEVGPIILVFPLN